MVEPLRLRDMSEFDDARFRPVCIEPSKGLYDVVDTLKSGTTTIESGLSWTAALSRARRLNAAQDKVANRGKTKMRRY